MVSLDNPQDRQEQPAAKLVLGLLRLEQALAAMRGAWAERAQLSSLQMQLLLDIDSGAGGCSSAADFARRYALSRATLSDSLRVLEQRRLVRSTRAREDRRRWELSLTAAGRRLAQAGWSELNRLTLLAESLPQKTRSQALEMVVTWIRWLAESGQISTDRLCVTCRFFERDRKPQATHPHWCHLIQAPLGGSDLRVDCPEHELLPTLS